MQANFTPSDHSFYIFYYYYVIENVHYCLHPNLAALRSKLTGFSFSTTTPPPFCTMDVIYVDNVFCPMNMFLPLSELLLILNPPPLLSANRWCIFHCTCRLLDSNDLPCCVLCSFYSFLPAGNTIMGWFFHLFGVK